ncbi:MAG: DUF262 domain-containing HNH endonuclease family protein [Alphaproteobacteria bacterium]|jgi:hypothetical protein|nr:DUF262 domain-containing HNH endonuclease family protein [Alphaproteobacteria bacterium]
MAVNLDTKNNSFRQILGNGIRYSVPRFQRDYSWEEEQWHDLWNDIDNVETGDIHYMGYLVLQSKDNNKEFIIIDGQQRLTTISLLIISCLYEIKELIKQQIDAANNERRLETLKASFLGFTSPVSLQTENKLTLNRNNQRYFSTYLSALQEPVNRKRNASERRMADAVTFFRGQIQSKHASSSISGESIAQFIETFVDQLYFTQITVGNDVNAYKIFETLNARGVQLSVPDLIKNYLFSMIDQRSPLHDNEIDNLEETWSHIMTQLGSKCNFSDFVRVEWNSRNPITSKNSLFKSIKSKTNSRENAHKYLKDLDYAAGVFAALQDDGDELWNNHSENKKIKSSLRALCLFGIKQPQSILLSAYKNFSPEEFAKLLRYIEVVSFRYNFIGNFQPNVQEKIYSEIANGISGGALKRTSHAKDLLKKIYIDNDEFISRFKNKEIKMRSSDKKARYVLARLEEYINPTLVLKDEDYTIEHVFPKNPSPEWYQGDSNDDDLADLVGSLGNLVLLDKDTNAQLGNKNFSLKKEVLEKSPLLTTNMVGKYPIWNKDSIEKRANFLAEKAAQCWSLQWD